MYDKNASAVDYQTIDAARESLNKKGYPFVVNTAPGNSAITMHVGTVSAGAYNDSVWTSVLKTAGYPLHANPDKVNHFLVVVLLIS